jgi:hypothetical protein
MHHVDGVVDIERHHARRPFVAVHPQLDERVAQPDHLAQARCILQARQGRLRTQIPTRIRQPATGELERRIIAQTVEIVAVLVAARDGEDAGADHVGKTVNDARRIAPLGKYPRQLIGQPDAPVRQGEKHDTPIRRQASTVECGCDLLASYGWKRERQNRIVAHGECGGLDVCAGLDSTTESYVTSQAYATLASLPNDTS